MFSYVSLPNNSSADDRDIRIRSLSHFLFTAVTICCLNLLGFCEQATAQVKTSVTEPYESSKIAAAEQGVIHQIKVAEGQFIEAGQVLAELDLGILLESRKLAELRANSESAINSAKAELRLRESQKKNMDDLIESGHANPFEVEQVVAKFEQATAEYEGALEKRAENQAELKRIDAEIKRRAIRSPISGVITEVHKRHGEFVSANDPIFATVVQLDRLRVRFYLNSDTTSQLLAGQRVTIYVGKNQVAVEGVIEFVSPVVEPKTGLARVNVLIANDGLRFRSGVVCSWERARIPASPASFNGLEDR